MLYRRWVKKPDFEILSTDDDAVQICITATIMNCLEQVFDYEETITISNDEIVEPSDVYGVIAAYLNDWTIKKEAELP